jgi:hypothetical protein
MSNYNEPTDNAKRFTLIPGLPYHDGEGSWVEPTESGVRVERADGSAYEFDADHADAALIVATMNARTAPITDAQVRAALRAKINATQETNDHREQMRVALQAARDAS